MTATVVATPVRRDSALTDRVLEVGRAHGLVAVGVTTAEPFHDARNAIEERREAGLNGDMQFTYRNPQRSTDPQRILEGARSIVAGAWATNAAVSEAPANAGRIGRYVWRDNYLLMRAALEAMMRELQAAGHVARIVQDDNALVDRAVAHRAGLGWYGKNANILVPGHGSWVVLGSVVTTAALVPAEQPVADGCGTCQRCIDGCPTQAIVGPGVVDARRCLAWLVQAPGSFPVEFREALGDRIYGCDDCQEVCPPAKVVTRRAPATDAPFVDLLWMLQATNDELMERHGRWYIANRDPRHLKRNALLALGNTADPNDDAVQDVLRDVVRSGDELLAEHAVWALARLAARA